MLSPLTESPTLLPVLSAGHHHTPRTGACFMEFASYLAGERWSDHPACTHPTLAFLARMVNDCTSDRARSRLAVLIPSVIGLTGDEHTRNGRPKSDRPKSDRRVELLVALRAATAALPIASEERQRALAVGILSCEARLTLLGYSDDGALRRRSRQAFELAPFAERWARTFVAENQPSTKDRAVVRMSASIIRIAVLGIAQACSPGADARLYSVLQGAISDCAVLLRTPLLQAPLRQTSIPQADSVEGGAAGARALQFEESVVAGDRDHPIPERERLGATRGR